MLKTATSIIPVGPLLSTLCFLAYSFPVSCAIYRDEHQRFTKMAEASTAERHAKLKLIIDCDAGIDDAQAIMIALSQDVDVLAITCTFGNAAIDQVTKNVLKILEVCGRTDIPVYRGAHQAMLGKVINLKVHLPIHFFAYIHVRRSKIERIYESMIRWVHTSQRHYGKIMQTQKTPQFVVLCH